MSLRVRLTLLYTSLVGGIFLLFGVAVYIAVRVTITNQVDDLLRRTVTEIVGNTRVDLVGELSVITALPSLDLPADVYVQVWGNDQSLRAASPNIGQLNRALDPSSLRATTWVYREVYLGSAHLRVLSVPLRVSANRVIGVLQIAHRLAVVEATQRTLMVALTIGTLISITIAGLAVWFSTAQALSPLNAVTRVALHITRADDLSRRIPYHGPSDDEVGQLIHAFNQTLSRLENLFNTQRRFLADVGHELRTPLTVIRGNVGLMRRMGDFDEESLCSIEDEVERLQRLVGDLLLLAQAEAGKIPLDHRMLELDTLLLEVLNQMRVIARDKLTLRLGEIDQVLVCGDRDRLKQVLINLVSNAISYTPAGGEVLVGLSKVGGQACLTVSDTGPGIPPEDLPHIFERFYRGEKSRPRSRDGKGFGLGLSIAYWIVKGHAGRIEVDSTEARGATFTVWLPLSDGNCEAITPRL